MIKTLNIKKIRRIYKKIQEQQATKALSKDDKPTGKSKLKLNLTDKRDFKLTVSRALNVEEIEIKQSLAAVKRARLKEKEHSRS